MTHAASRSGSDRRNAAQALAAEALLFIASDDDRLMRFMALTGLDASSLRERAADPDFLAAVMDHLLQDEAALVAFASDQRLRPEAVVAQARVLGVVPWERDEA